MNLSTLDIGLASTGSKDASPPATAAATTPADPCATPAAFGQLMAQALQQATPPGQAPGADTDKSLAQPEGEAGQAMAGTDPVPPQPMDPSLLAQWMAIPAVHQVSVGPTLQAITASTTTPDSTSLAAFAKAQGLDAKAIAWLLAPGAAAPVAASGAGQEWQITLPAATASPLAPAGTGAAAATAAAGWVPPILGAWAAQTQGLTSTASGAPAASAPAEPDPTAITLSGLRWVPPGLVGAGANATARAPASWTFAQAQDPRWSETELDLSGLPGLESASTDAAITPDASALSPSLAEPPVSARETPALARQTPTGTATPTADNPTTQKAASDQMQQLADQMADAIGERMIREIERGHWSMRLMLKPAHLGHIEVEMRLRAGELDASFAAPQAATRELLQDGLSRLKDSLSEMGMDVANLDVKTGQNRQSGGEPTPGQRQIVKTPSNSDTSDVTTAATLPASRPRRPDGWDVMV